MLKNKRGFTVVELIVSLSITLVIVYFLLNIVLDLKDIYVKDGIRTELYIKQGTMMKKTIDSFNDKNLVKISKLDGNCLVKLEYYDSENEKSESKNICYDTSVSPNKYSVGDYNTKLVNESYIDKDEIEVSYDDANKVFHLYIPIKSDLVDGDYGINIVHIYNNSVTVDVS